MKKMFFLKQVVFLLTVCASLSLSTNFANAQDVVGKIQEGEKKITMCIGCHGIAGYQASFPHVHKVPMISGQDAKYLNNALTSYQKGERKHPTMQSVVAPLSEQDMADLSVFYEQHGASTLPSAAHDIKEPSEQVKALLQKGACMSCHGDSFNRPINGAAKLAGQHPDYLYIALKSYQTSGNRVFGRSNAIMAGQIKGWTHDELQAVAQYLGGLHGDLHVTPQSRFRRFSQP
jgi:cytochrome c553